MPADQHIVITGATGYVGGRLLAAARAGGWWVTVLSRRPPVGIGHDRRTRWIAWALEDPVPETAFRPEGDFPAVDSVIHLAHLWDAGGNEREINLNGTRWLLEGARANGVRRFIFGSTISAREDALNDYGRLKWEIEQLLDGAELVIARIGLVYGGPRRSQWGTLYWLIRKLPALPMIASEKLVQPIHVDDLGRALLRLASVEKLGRRLYPLADPEPISFGAFLKMLADQAFGKRLVVVRLPVGLTLTALKLLNCFRLISNNLRERMLGLAGLQTMDCREELVELGITLRPLTEGLAGVLFRRRFALEGRVLLNYVLGRTPSLSEVRLYVRGVERFYGGVPLEIPAIARSWPALLGVWEPIGRRRSDDNDIVARLHLAVTMTEAMAPARGGAYDYEGEGVLKATINFIFYGAMEVTLLPFRAFFGRRRG